ncbi:MAG: M48 family metallopeptidase [Candidatus Omnitrophota bacterium]|nr:M48 family metallopeptidase [Candidatus Omnitrophota bacterium]
MFYQYKKVTLLLTAVIFLTGCAAIEYNRALKKEELILMSSSREVKLGKSLAKKVEKKLKLSNDDLLRQRVKAIGQIVAGKCDRKDIIYHFDVLDIKEINAFALPGGYIYVYEGLLDNLDQESFDDELSYILGHEIAHVVAKHSVKRIQSVLGYTLLKLVIASNEKTRKISRGADLAFNSIMLGYSKKDEFIADSLGIKYMQKAGYDPQAAIKFLRKLREIEKSKPSKPLYYVSTHPTVHSRIANIRTAISGKLTFEDYIGKIGELH